MNLRIKSLVLSAMAGAAVMLTGCADTAVDKVVSLNNQYADAFERTTTIEEFTEQQTAYNEALNSLTQEISAKEQDLTEQEISAVERSFNRLDSCMSAASSRVGLY